MMQYRQIRQLLPLAWVEDLDLVLTEARTHRYAGIYDRLSVNGEAALTEGK